jgi:hypothetical protein
MIEILKISLIAFMFCALGTKGMIFEWYQKLIKRLPKYLNKPIGGCYKCFTGQVCFWYFLISRFYNYNLIEHLFFVSAGIMSAMVYHKLYCWLK